MKNLLVKGQGASPSLFCSAPAGRKETLQQLSDTLNCLYNRV